MKRIALALVFFSFSLRAEDDGKLTIEIPSSVQASVAKEKGDTGKVRDFKRVNESDGTTYIVGLVLEGKNYIISLDAGGRLMKKQLETEDADPKPLKIAGTPPKVRATLQREAGAGVIEEIEVHTAKTAYVTEVKVGKRKYRIEVDADGALINKEYVGDDEG